jgi:hypothetical protein
MKDISITKFSALCLSAAFVAAVFIETAEARRGGGGGGHGGGTHTNLGGHDRGGNRGDFNGSGNRGGNNVNVSGNRGGHNNVNIDVDNGWNNGRWDNDWHPVATAAAVTATVAVTRAVVGTTVYVLPASSCSNYTYSGVYYYNCGDDWYQPRYVGTQVTYVVVRRPY